VLNNYGSSKIGSTFELNINVISFPFSLPYDLIHSIGVIIGGLWVLSGLPLKADVALLGGIPWSSHALAFLVGCTT